MHQTFGPDEIPWGSSLGIKVIDGNAWSSEGIFEVESKPKARKKKKSV